MKFLKGTAAFHSVYVMEKLLCSICQIESAQSPASSAVTAARPLRRFWSGKKLGTSVAVTHEQSCYDKYKMDGNKDEAQKCRQLAEKYLKEGNKERAMKFLEKSQKLYPSKEVQGRWKSTVVLKSEPLKMTRSAMS